METPTKQAKHNVIDAPLYKGSDVARYLDAPTATVLRWFFGRSGNAAPLVPADTKEHELSFTNLVEAHVLLALRKQYRMPLQRIRESLRYLEDELQTPHPLADRRLKTDKVFLYLDDKSLINASKRGQTAIRDVIGPHLERIEWDRAGVLLRLWPPTRPADSLGPFPKVVTIDPRISLGRPTLAATGVRTAIVAQRFRGGDSLQALANDYGRSIGEIEEAVRFESRAA